MYYQQHRYKLKGQTGSLKLSFDPLGWKDSETEISRSENTYGVFLTISNNLEFYGEAKEFLDREYAIYGVQANVILTKFITHPITNEWQLAYTGTLDFTSRKIENNRFVCDFVEGGLRELLSSQSKEKYELNRITDIKGNPISELQKNKLVIDGRDIYFLNKWEPTPNTPTFEQYSGIWASVDEDRQSFHPFPIQAKAVADPENVGTPAPLYGADRRYRGPDLINMFWSTSERDRGLVRLNIDNLRFKVEDLNPIRTNKYHAFVVVQRYTSDDNGDNVTFVEDIFSEQILWDVPSFGQEFNIDFG